MPTLNLLDVSNGNPVTGTINAAATSAAWLQNIVNYFLSFFPTAGNATSTSVTYTAGSTTVAQPADFILDLRDGLIITVNTTQRRLKRRGLQDLIARSLNQNAGAPSAYAVQGANLLVAPTPDITYAGTLWYWQRPAALSGSDVPVFPSDLVLVEYVRIMALEWIRALPPNAALSYADAQIVKMRKAGLGFESEHDTIPMDPTVFIPGAGEREAGSWWWLGEIS